jgi:hypothetical protein
VRLLSLQIKRLILEDSNTAESMPHGDFVWIEETPWIDAVVAIDK